MEFENNRRSGHRVFIEFCPSLPYKRYSSEQSIYGFISSTRDRKAGTDYNHVSNHQKPYSCYQTMVLIHFHLHTCQETEFLMVALILFQTHCSRKQLTSVQVGFTYKQHMVPTRRHHSLELVILPSKIKTSTDYPWPVSLGKHGHTSDTHKQEVY